MDGALLVEGVPARGRSRVFTEMRPSRAWHPRHFGVRECDGMSEVRHEAAMHREDNARGTGFGRPKRCTSP